MQAGVLVLLPRPPPALGAPASVADPLKSSTLASCRWPVQKQQPRLSPSQSLPAAAAPTALIQERLPSATAQQQVQHPETAAQVDGWTPPKPQKLVRRSNRGSRRPPPPPQADTPQQQEPVQARAAQAAIDPAQLTAFILNGPLIRTLQHVLQHHSQHLTCTHVTALLHKATTFAASDPGTWYPGGLQKSGASSSRGPRPQQQQLRGLQPDASMDYLEAGAEGLGPDWGMSDEDDGRRQHSRRSQVRQKYSRPLNGVSDPGLPRQLDALERSQAFSQLHIVVQQTAHIASTLAAQGKMDAAGLSITLSSLAKLGYRDPEVLGRLMAACATAMPGMGAKAALNVVWGAAMLKLQPGWAWLQVADRTLCRLLDQMDAQQVCTAAYTLGLLRHRPSSELLSGLASRSAALLGLCRPVDIMHLCLGLAGMRALPDDAWVASFMSATSLRLRTFSLQELCRTLHALAALGCSPTPAWMSEFYSRCRAELADADDEAAAAAAAARAQALKPGPSYAQGLGSASGNRLSGASLRAGTDTRGSPEPATTAGGSKMRRLLSNSSPGSLAAGSLVPRAAGSSTMAAMSARTLAMLCSALARLSCRPEQRWMDECLARSRRALTRASAEDLSQLIASLAALRYRPGEAWCQAFLTASFQRLGSFTPQQTITTLGALVRLGQRPPGLWLPELMGRILPRLSQYTADELAQLLASLSALHYRPDLHWLAEYERVSQGVLSAASATSLADMVCALADMRYKPAVGWLYSFVLAAYSRLDTLDSTQLARVFGALPRISPHPMWLDELVQICASETSKGKGLSTGSIEEGSSSAVEDEEPTPQTTAAVAAGGTQEVEQVSSTNGISSNGHQHVNGAVVSETAGASLNGSRGLWSSWSASDTSTAANGSSSSNGMLRIYGLHSINGESIASSPGAAAGSVAFANAS